MPVDRPRHGRLAGRGRNSSCRRTPLLDGPGSRRCRRRRPRLGRRPRGPATRCRSRRRRVVERGRRARTRSARPGSSMTAVAITVPWFGPLVPSTRRRTARASAAGSCPRSRSGVPVMPPVGRRGRRRTRRRGLGVGRRRRRRRRAARVGVGVAVRRLERNGRRRAVCFTQWRVVGWGVGCRRGARSGVGVAALIGSSSASARRGVAVRRSAPASARASARRRLRRGLGRRLGRRLGVGSGVGSARGLRRRLRRRLGASRSAARHGAPRPALDRLDVDLEAGHGRFDRPRRPARPSRRVPAPCVPSTTPAWPT